MMAFMEGPEHPTALFLLVLLLAKSALCKNMISIQKVLGKWLKLNVTERKIPKYYAKVFKKND